MIEHNIAEKLKRRKEIDWRRQIKRQSRMRGDANGKMMCDIISVSPISGLYFLFLL